MPQQRTMLEGLTQSTQDNQTSATLLAQPELVQALSLLAIESTNVENRRLVTALLTKVYVQLDGVNEPFANDLKRQAALGLIAMHGPSSAREAAALGATPDQARRIFDWAGFDDRSRAARDDPSLRLMGVTGKGVPMTALDVSGSDHQAFTRAMAKPARAESALDVRGIPNARGRTLVAGVRAAIEAAAKNGDRSIVSISMGLDFDSDGSDYVEPGDEGLGPARWRFDADVASIRRAIDAFPGVVVLAGGNSGGFGARNALAESPKALVAGTLDVTERYVGLETTPAIHLDRMLLTGTLIFAPDASGQLQRLEAATSWAAPQLAQTLARVVEAGQFSAQEAATVLLKTQERVNGTAEIPGAGRADPIAAVALAKLIAAARTATDEA